MLASSLIDFDALWKILAAGLVGGAGVVLAFGLVLLGRSRYVAAREGDTATRAGALVLAGVSAAFCAAALVAGLLAMTHKS